MEHNRVVELGSLIKPAKTIRCGDDYYPVLSMTMHDGLVFQEEKFKKEVASKNKADYKVVFKNQLVVGFPIDEGVLATQRIVDAGIVSPAYGIWDVDQSKIHPEFLEWALRSARALDYYRAKLRGSTARRRSLPTETFLKFTLPLPSISEQMHILDIIHKLQVMLRPRQQQLAKLDELVKARFVEIFGDLAAPDCLWLSVRLIDTCENQDAIKCGPFGTQLSKEEYKSDGVAVWEIPQINSQFVSSPTHYLTEEKAKQLQSYSICPGDIAMSRKGNVGKCAVFPKEFEPGIIHSDVLRIRVDQKRVLPVFMMCQLHFSKAVQHQIKLVSSGAIMAGINVTKLKKIYVHIPPMDLQRRFVAFVESVDKTKLSIQNGLEQMEILKKALMQKYFG